MIDSLFTAHKYFADKTHLMQLLSYKIYTPAVRFIYDWEGIVTFKSHLVLYDFASHFKIQQFTFEDLSFYFLMIVHISWCRTPLD